MKMVSLWFSVRCMILISSLVSPEVGYSNLRQCILDLESRGMLIRIKTETDPDLEMAEIHRRVFAAGGPAILYEKVKASPFPAVSNIFGSAERCRYIFRDSLKKVEKLIRAKIDPVSVLKQPFRNLDVPFTALNSLPKKSWMAPVLKNRTTIDKLPAIRSWPDDGGPFITLPQVYTEDIARQNPMGSNLGMYRIQLSGNRYRQNEEVGMHYQIHRGIGVHHAGWIEKGMDMPVSIFVGGPPSHSFSAVMPLPEGLSEVMFAGMLGHRRWRYKTWEQFRISADADFCIVGTVAKKFLPEGPFGDHLGYYSLSHDFPVLNVKAVFHRDGAIWPFTVVGRPPQEDTFFGKLIHELTGPIVPSEIAGLHAMHAVDAAGVHPLLLAIGSERYVPYAERKPREILTIANAILGFNQASLAKYLMIAAREDDPKLHLHDIQKFLIHILERTDWNTDLHFQTCTTIDTLDYSGSGFNEGSKVVIAAAGPARYSLATEMPPGLRLPGIFSHARLAIPGVLVVSGPPFENYPIENKKLEEAARGFDCEGMGIRLIVIADESGFTAKNLNNFLWVTFTRSNPSHDIYGMDSFIENKHWGCRGALIIDARIKPHHAPLLIEDPAITKRVDALGAAGGPLHGMI